MTAQDNPVYAEVNTAGLRASSAPSARRMPIVSGKCPACDLEALFLAVGGWVTCASLHCPDPCAAAGLLEKGKS